MVIVTSLLFLLLGFQITGAENKNYGGENRFILNVVIRQLIESFRDVIRNGDLEKNIEILDPYAFDYATFDLTTDITGVATNLTSGIFAGLGDYQLGPFDFNKNNLSIDLELTFPIISLSSEYYKLEGNLIGIFPLFGNGAMQIQVHNMVLNGRIYLKQSDDEKSILVSHFENVEFTIETVKSNTQFDGNIDEVVNAMIEELLAYNLSRFSKAICAAYGDIAVEGLNTILNKFDNWKIISVIL